MEIPELHCALTGDVILAHHVLDDGPTGLDVRGIAFHIGAR